MERASVISTGFVQIAPSFSILKPSALAIAHTGALASMDRARVTTAGAVLIATHHRIALKTALGMVCV